MAKRRTSRDTELSTRAAIREKLLKVFDDVETGFVDQVERSDRQMDWWDIYNCNLGNRQFYSGNARIFVPIVRDAVKARKTRFVNQMFPQSGRYVEVTTENGDIPHAETALLEFYVRRAKLRTEVMPALLVNGDVEGHYHLYVDWESRERQTVAREQTPLMIGGIEHPELGSTPMVKKEKVEDFGPSVEVLHDADVLILPASADSVDDALARGGSVTVIRRWSKSKIEEMRDDDQIVVEHADALLTEMQKVSQGKRDVAKALADAAGIRAGGRMALIHETWTRIKVDGEKRLVRAYYAGDSGEGGKIILGCKLCPYWCDRAPLISAPVEKIAGVFKGKSQVEPCADVQYEANDAINQGADSATYGLLPIIMTDPEKNPKVGTMVLDLAAVWETSPRDTQFAQFPALWQHAFEIVASCKQQIFQTLGVNPAMMPQSSGSKGKRSQAELATEQQVDLLTTADAVTVIEESILTPLIERFAEYDSQFRDDEVTIRAFGQLGQRAKMEQVPPAQMGKRWFFRWLGVEAAKNAQQIQQQVAMLNVLRGIPPDLYKGYRLDLVPMIEQIVMSVVGPRLAPLTFVGIKDELTLDPQIENEMMAEGFDLSVHPLDNDVEHMKAHQEAMMAGDVHGTIRAHMLKHQQSMQMKTMANAPGQGAGASAPGTPGTPPAGAGGAPGTPRVGGSPGGPRGSAQQPPGRINPDRMQGVVTMPRRMG